MRLEDLPLIYCLTCTFVALEDIASQESEADADLGEKADFTTVSVHSLFNTPWIWNSCQFDKSWVWGTCTCRAKTLCLLRHRISVVIVLQLMQYNHTAHWHWTFCHYLPLQIKLTCHCNIPDKVRKAKIWQSSLTCQEKYVANNLNRPWDLLLQLNVTFMFPQPLYPARFSPCSFGESRCAAHLCSLSLSLTHSLSISPFLSLLSMSMWSWADGALLWNVADWQIP